MTLRKITIDNSVRYITKTEKENKQNTIENKKSEQIQPISGGGKPNTRKKNKNCSKNNKKILTNAAASGFGYITN